MALIQIALPLTDVEFTPALRRQSKIVFLGPDCHPPGHLHVGQSVYNAARETESRVRDLHSGLTAMV